MSGKRRKLPMIKIRSKNTLVKNLILFCHIFANKYFSVVFGSDRNWSKKIKRKGEISPDGLLKNNFF